ncbi:ABC transporter ATP-binding protein [Lactococcus petauri]|uniref:ABC transporter ATP-binding protein n=1 Tax=Lactococcus TaxID=1357 RepID=UPI00031FDA2B|nr:MULTISPECIES: ABC transporter ATP-binding protein [Lactococcus]MCA9746386.1 ABC transporter ATP-binding protein [Lactococcus sp.]PST72987.1 glycine/betaine ABC transporter ATP-binding protein [Lactococcus garvieae]MBK4109111.1 ABC transporter ATP-binding protein [Lactococcus petauri]MCR8689085.1 ABC transporter ATP-binding protein [Lactococcus petauri]MDC0810052.1 ABC transporter ATP-binding protein [Lactococcus petauri]
MTITFKNVTKKYGDKAVLSDINLSIESHEFFVLAGSSGGGKTTLLKMVNRLIEPNKGQVLIDDQDIQTINLRDLRLQIGYVLQQIALFPNMTVLENIGIIPTMKGWSKRETRERVLELLPLVGLDAEKYLNRYPHELSGGEAQRIGILRAIACKPKIILMDEPFSALDPISRKQLQELVKDLQKTLKITTVFVTHDMSEGMAMADRIAILKDGELQQVGRPQEILNAPANTFVADFFTDYQQDLSQYKLKNLEQVLATHDFSEETPLGEILNSLEDDAHE